MIEKAIVHELRQDLVIQQLIGDPEAVDPDDVFRMSPNHMGQEQAYPRIAYRIVSREGVRRVQDGPINLVRVRMQLDLYATTYTGIVNLSDRVRRVLDGLSKTIAAPGGNVVVDSIALEDTDDGSERAQDGGAGTVHRRSMDFMIWHREAVGI